MQKLAMVAFGGNALLKAGEKETFAEQLRNVENTCAQLCHLIARGYDIVIAHGNGPQVGNGLLRQEAGKKVFGLCVVHTNCVRMEPGAMFVRTFLGKFTIEGMIPVLTLIMLYFGMVGLAGTAVILVLLIVQIILMIATQNNQLIHDLLAQSAVADYQSQPIYATLDELNQAKARKAAEAARLTPYD